MDARGPVWLVVMFVAAISCGGPDAAPHPGRGTRISAAQVAPGPSERDAVHWHDALGLPPFPVFAPLGPVDGTALFVGNSFTFFNELPSVYRELAGPRRVASVTAGGYHLREHVIDAAREGSDIAAFFAEPWDVLTLQEQSQIAGFSIRDREYQSSQAAAERLSELARPAAVVIYATWGKEHGDPFNTHLFPTFDAMEERVEIGYRAMASRLAERGHRVRIAPVGAAFARIEHAVRDAGDDPERDGSAFDALYAADGYHPAAPGTYLAACVIASTISGRDPITFADPDESLALDAETAYGLRLVARATLTDPAWMPR